MAHTACQHCGYVRKLETVESINGFGEHCPDCGRQLAEAVSQPHPRPRAGDIGSMRARPLPDFRIARQALNGTMLILLEGELDLSKVEWLQEELAAAERSDAERIVLDLSGLSFIDSSGIAVLVAAVQRSSQDSDRLRIKRAKAPGVKRILQLTGIDDRLPFLD